MSYRLKIPLDAIKTKEIKGIIINGEYAGKELIVSKYEGEASQGAASNFKRVPHVWIKISGGGWIKPEFKRFSGKNIAEVDNQLEKLQKHLKF